MDIRPRYAVADAYAEAWRLKGPLLLAHLATLLLFAGLLAPVVALALRAALMLSGTPALTDKDIALFLLSPVGAVAMLAVGALFLAVQVVGLAVKMAVLSAERGGRHLGVTGALGIVAGQGPRLVGFALGLTLRVLASVVPFLAAGGAVALLLLGDYDINFYLSERPPEFLLAAGLIALIVLGLAAVLVPRLLGWAVALPLVLFGGTSPRASFGASRAHMAGRRWGLLRRLVLWALVAVALGIAVASVSGLAARLSALAAGEDIARLAPLLLLSAGLLAALNVVVAALTSGALAHLLLDEADWPQDRARPTAPASARFAVPLAAALVLLAGGAVLLSSLSAPRVTVPTDIEVIAHRGGALARPENTIAAMERGIADGADWLEIDVQESADGEVVVIHDSDFMKLAGNPTKVWDATVTDLAGIDIGSWFDPAYADQRVPTLAEVLELSKDRSNVLIELKYYGHDEMLEERVAAIVEATGMTDQIAAMSLTPKIAEGMKALRPDWQVGLLAATALGPLDRVAADFLAVNAAIATPALIRRAEAAGKEVYVWTLNDAASMARMAGLGVSGLITDRPALANRVLADLGALSAAERFALSLADRLGLDLSGPEMRDASP